MAQTSTEDLYGKAMELAGTGEDNFLDLAKSLRQLQDRDPDLFKRVHEKTDLGKRKAYYLADISRVFEPLPIARSRLRKLGWTRLEALSKHINKGNAQELLKIAENSTVKQLRTYLRGEQPISNAHCVLMYFTPQQYEELEAALLENGGSKSGRGILNKEEALLNALKKSGDQGSSKKDHNISER
jgi:hypothetical protein